MRNVERQRRAACNAMGIGFDHDLLGDAAQESTLEATGWGVVKAGGTKHESRWSAVVRQALLASGYGIDGCTVPHEVFLQVMASADNAATSYLVGWSEPYPSRRFRRRRMR